jgi:hypothetical protein
MAGYGSFAGCALARGLRAVHEQIWLNFSVWRPTQEAERAAGR